MGYKDKIIACIAKKACDKISGRVIRSLQEMTDEMQSGDDSGLKNVWDEVCSQVQYEESFFWEVYLDTIRDLICFEMDKLDYEIIEAIWLQTDEGFYSGDDEEEDEIDLYIKDDVVEYIMNEFVLKTADEWTNKRIRKYIKNSR
jgi:hypothetical protein